MKNNIKTRFEALKEKFASHGKGTTILTGCVGILLALVLLPFLKDISLLSANFFLDEQQNDPVVASSDIQAEDIESDISLRSLAQTPTSDTSVESEDEPSGAQNPDENVSTPSTTTGGGAQELESGRGGGSIGGGTGGSVGGGGGGGDDDDDDDDDTGGGGGLPGCFGLPASECLNICLTISNALDFADCRDVLIDNALTCLEDPLLCSAGITDDIIACVDVPPQDQLRCLDDAINGTIVAVEDIIENVDACIDDPIACSDNLVDTTLITDSLDKIDEVLDDVREPIIDQVITMCTVGSQLIPCPELEEVVVAPNIIDLVAERDKLILCINDAAKKLEPCSEDQIIEALQSTIAKARADGDTVINVTEALTSNVANTINDPAAAVDNTIANTQQGIDNAINTATGTVDDAIDNVTSGVDNTVGTVQQTIDDTLTGAGQVIDNPQEALNNTVESINNTGNTITNGVDSVVESINNVVPVTPQNIGNLIPGF